MIPSVSPDETGEWMADPSDMTGQPFHLWYFRKKKSKDKKYVGAIFWQKS